MRFAYAGFDLMYPAMKALCAGNELIKLFTCEVDGKYETNDRVSSLADSLGAPRTALRITPADIEELIDRGCELLVSAGYYHRIPTDPRLRAVNIHPSPLPYGRGAWPMPHFILDGLPEGGVTVHKTKEGFDTGDILLQRRFPLSPREDLESYMAKVNALLPDMMSELISGLDGLWGAAREQGEGVYLPEPDPAAYVLGEETDVEYADRVLRAFYGFPCYYKKGDSMTGLLRARAVKGGSAGREYPLKDGFIEP